MMPRSIASCALAGALAFVSSGQSSVTARATEGIKASSTRGVPQVAPRPALAPGAVWVPDRWVPLPGDPRPVHVPGRWERRLGDRMFYAPPATVGRPVDGTAQTIPAGIRPPVEERTEIP